jgi:hypothetical protein
MQVGRNDEAVRQKAYEIWEQEGRQDGRDQEHWYRAESELGETPSDNWDQDSSEGEMDGAGIAGATNPRQRGRSDA